MPKFSKKSRDKLSTCHPDIQKVLNEAIRHFDFTILEGHRGQQLQDSYYEQGKSKLKYPRSKHNQSPSKAVDIAPWPIDWNNTYRFHAVANRIIGIGLAMGIHLKYGGDWDNDLKNDDQTFHDLPHLELID
jgi:peptidoglycan L-alanyl-D-glutamate endopeptidase CwlK